MFFMVLPLIPQQAFGQVPGLARLPCVMRALDWRPTVRTRTETLWISEYLTAVIWSFVSEAVKWLFQTLKSGQRKY